MISRHYKVFQIVDGAVTPHTHPVFTGEVSWDIPNRGQEITVCPETELRIFSSENEILTAVNDYFREEPEPVPMESFFVVPMLSVRQYSVRQSKSKTIK